MKIFLAILLVLSVLIVFAGWRSSRFGYESAAYEVLEKSGAFEIRKYSNLTLASTSMDNGDPMEGGTFMRLFKYIAKGNESGEKIAMTTPVFMTSDNGEEMSFVLPREVARQGAPDPLSNEVSIDQRQFGVVASYRYSGKWNQEEQTRARETLTGWLEEREIATRGDFFSAGYDPPFTPPFLRRNEALVKVVWRENDT